MLSVVLEISFPLGLYGFLGDLQVVRVQLELVNNRIRRHYLHGFIKP